MYIPLNSYDINNYSYFNHTYKDSPALFEINRIIDNSSGSDIVTVNINLINQSCVNYNINDEIIISIPITIQISESSNNIKNAIIDFGTNHLLNTNDYIFISNYYNPLITNDYLLIDDNMPYIINIIDNTKISFNLSSFISQNLDQLEYHNYQIFKTVDNKTYTNNILNKFISDSVYNNNILNYSFNIPGSEILKIRTNGILQLVTNQENNNTNISNNNKGTKIHLLANNQNSQIYLQSKESTKYDSIKIKSENGGIDINANNNISINAPLLNQNSSNIYFNTNTHPTNNINLLNLKGEGDNSILLQSRFGNINIGGLENDLTSIYSGKLQLKSKGNIITLNLSQNIIAKKYDLVTQLNVNNLLAIVYEDTNNNKLKLKMLIDNEFSVNNINDKIILNELLQDIYIISIDEVGLTDAIVIETNNKSANYISNNDIITIKNHKGNNNSIITGLNPYTNNNTNLQSKNRPNSSIILSSNKGGILLDTKLDQYIDLNGGRIAISSTYDSIDSLNLFTNSLGINETINMTNFSGILDNNDLGLPNTSSIQIISKNGGTKLEVHKNKQLLIQTKHFDENGNHSDESAGNHGYLNLISKGLSDVGENVPFNINSSGGINITSGQRISIHSNNNDQNNSMILHSIGCINFKADANNNIISGDKMNLISNGLNDVGLNVAFNIYSSAGINITSVQRTCIHTSNDDPDNSMILSSLGGINIHSKKNNNIISDEFTNIESINENINLTTTNNKQTIITNEDQALLDGSASFKVMGGAYISKDLIVNQNITVVGNFTVLGNKTEINTDTLIVDDPLIVIGANNSHIDNYYGGFAIKHSNGKININNYNNKLYINVSTTNYTVIIDSGSYTFEELRLELQNKIKLVPSTDFNTQFSVLLTSDNQINFIYNSSIFILQYQNTTNDYPNNILSTIGFLETQKNSNSYTGNKLSFYKFSGLVRKPTNNRFYLLQDQKDIITTSSNVDTSNPDFTLSNTTDLIKTELELSKIILNDGSINTTTNPTEGSIQYNVVDNFNLLNAYIKEYPTTNLKNISLSRYTYVSLQFYFNDLSNNLQWGNRVSGQIDPDVAIFSKTILNRFMWSGNQNLYIQHIEINVDEFNNNTDRYYQLRLVTDEAIDNLDIMDNTGVLLTTTNDIIKTPMRINGTVTKKEINVIPLNSDLIDYNSDSNNLINNNTLQIIGGIDKFIGLQLKSIINSNSLTNEVVVTLRGFTSFY